jgi:hypothetical protein
MKGVHLRTNSITFTPSCTGADEVAFCGQRSTAARFEHLLHEARWTKMVMLHYAAECVTDDIIKMALQKYPAVSSVFRPCFRAISRAFDFGHMPRSYQLSQDIFTASFCDAVQYTLDLISDHPKFQDLISQACGSSRHYFGDRSPFAEGSHRQVLAWRPDPWLIPSIAELHVIEQFSTEAPSPIEKAEYEYYGGIQLYFSATAICIATLKRLTKQNRVQMRSVILQEQCRSISNPEVHTEGLISYCKENTKLHIVMHAGFSTNLCPSLWAKRDAALLSPRDATQTRKHNYIRIAVDRLIRTAALPSLGMPSHSFKVVLDVHPEGAGYSWRYIQRAAVARAHLSDSILHSDDNTDTWILTDMFAKLWRLPLQLSSVIGDIFNGESLFRVQSFANGFFYNSSAIDLGSSTLTFLVIPRIIWRSILLDTNGVQNSAWRTVDVRSSLRKRFQLCSWGLGR